MAIGRCTIYSAAQTVAFAVAMLPGILALHQNKYALMKDGEVVGFYSTLEDAYVTANKFYADQPFSVQKVTDIPVDLGFFSHAVGSR
jgi:Family of unknown function (DUF5678)